MISALKFTIFPDTLIELFNTFISVSYPNFLTDPVQDPDTGLTKKRIPDPSHIRIVDLDRDKKS